MTTDLVLAAINQGISHGTGKASRFWLAWFITMMPAASTLRCGSPNDS